MASASMPSLHHRPRVSAATDQMAGKDAPLRLLLILCAAFHYLLRPIAGLDEADILISFKNSVGKEGLNQLNDWQASDSSSLCSWTGVSCDPSSHTVTALDLSSQNLSSPLSNALCQLPNLTQLVLNNNNFEGPFPLGLLDCARLAKLDISANHFLGPLPDNLSTLGSLTFLDVSANNFTGAIPSSLGLLWKLQYLNFWNNALTGAIPPQLGNLTQLRNLTLSWNFYTQGLLPSELRNLSQISWFSCAACQLVGGIPEWITELQELEFLELSYNNLSGNIPGKFFQWKKLSQLELYFNMFTGPIPPEVGNVTSLTELDLSCNSLSGPIPYELGHLTNLVLLNLWNNTLTGEIPESLAELPNMQYFKVFQNQLTGNIPQNFGNSRSLVIFDVSTNQLTGTVPPNICSSGKLLRLILFTNFISGSIPEQYGNCTTLVRVRISDNQLTGNVPTGLWALPEMEILELSDNQLTGFVPPSIDSAVQLRILNIFNNHISGSLPDTVGHLHQLEQLLAHKNRFVGFIPNTLCFCTNLTFLTLNMNHLSGTIPPEIGNLAELTHLDLSSNDLTGEIPSTLGNLNFLTFLDLSTNQLSGWIPSQLKRLQYVATTFNVSYNDLSGQLPFVLAGAFNYSSFKGNEELCVPGLPMSRSCTRKGKNGPGIGSWITITVLGVLVISIALLCYARKRRQLYHRMRQDSMLKEGEMTFTPFVNLCISQDEILNALDEDNIIGRGGSGQVYFASLNDGTAVAIKRLWVSRKDDASDYGFKAEVETLGKIRHTNIVKLLCCCFNSKMKLLVYEYMSNGSLGDLLHGSKKHLLDSRTRIRIALGAAQGLAYLHHDCCPPIVHRDIKSNNILLDDNCEAHIADFGLAKMLTGSCESGCNVTAVAGSYGYIAPEYSFASKVNEKCDVYSYGVVLLELVTGKLPTDPEFGSGIDIVRWVSGRCHSKESILALLDPKLDGDNQHEMLLLFKLALQCTSVSPSHRPNMRDVAYLLLQADQQISPGSFKDSKSGSIKGSKSGSIKDSKSGSIKDSKPEGNQTLAAKVSYPTLSVW